MPSYLRIWTISLAFAALLYSQLTFGAFRDTPPHLKEYLQGKEFVILISIMGCSGESGFLVGGRLTALKKLEARRTEDWTWILSGDAYQASEIATSWMIGDMILPSTITFSMETCLNTKAHIRERSF